MNAKIEEKASIKAWIFWICTALFYFYQFVLRVTPNVVGDELIQEFKITASELGTLSFFYYLSYATLQIPIGFLIDKYGPKKLISAAAAFCALGCFLFGCADRFYFAQIAMFCLGIGSSCGFVGCLIVSSRYFPEKMRPTIIGLTLFLGTSGGMLSGILVPKILNFISWKDFLLLCAIVGVAIGFLVFSLLKESRKESIETTLSEQEGILATLKKLIVNKQLWILSLYSMCIYTPLSAIADMWGIAFVKSRCGVDKEAAGLATSNIYLGMICMSPIFGYFVAKIKNIRLAMFTIPALIVAVLLAIIWLPNMTIGLITILFFVLGVLEGTQSITFDQVALTVPQKYIGSAFGFTNALCMASGLVCSPIIGIVLDFVWNKTYENNIPFYTPSDYQEAMSIIPAFVAICLLLVLTKTFPRAEKSLQ